MDQFPQHSSYTEMKPVWQMCRDAATGQRAIHKGGEKYLDKLEGQSTEQYKKYLRRATFLGATGRTLEAMTGLIFRKAPAIELPTAMESWAQDIDLAGTTLEGMLNKAVTEVGKVGRGGVLVDHPPKRDDLTLEQARALSFRPYAAYYTAENIINWKFQRVGNVTKLAYVCLAENHDDDPDKEQYRELELVDGLYQQNIWRENGEQYDLEVIEPKMNGQRIADIPFFFLAPKEPGQDIQPPCCSGLKKTTNFQKAFTALQPPNLWSLD